MNNKAQLAGLGVLLTVALGIIVGAILLQASAPAVAQVNTLQNINNQSITLPATNGNVSLTGQSASNVILTNRTSGTVVPASNYTITNNVLINGQLYAVLQLKDGNFSGNVMNISYTSEPFGYANDSGSRVMIGLVLVFGALAIFAMAISPIGKALKDLF